MLGLWMAPSGNRSKLLNTLRLKAIAWGRQVRTGNPSPIEAWTALHTNISARLKYPLPACTFSEQECKSIMFPAIKAALPKAGLCGSIASPIRDGPGSSGGIGVSSLFAIQGSTRTTFLEHVFKATPTGKMITNNIESIA